MKIEIWSDVMCPFCYIGKRHFEKALEGFPGKADIEVEWKSFQLNPDMETAPGRHINEYLAEKKGWTVEQARQANEYVTGMAAAAGLQYDMDQAVVANSFDAHRMIQLAKSLGKGDIMEENLFRAYFTEGKNIADHHTLTGLAENAGIDREKAAAVLAGDQFQDAVEKDLYEAQQIGVRGVPFFVLNNHYAVSGAQPVEAFTGAITTAWQEWKQGKPLSPDAGENTGKSCPAEGNCQE